MSDTPPSSLTPPAGNSRSASPSFGAGGASGSTYAAERPRIVSGGSIKDRIARFNNPSATPLLPTHAFGTSGPAGNGGGGSGIRGGMVGNRLPGLDPKTAGMAGMQGRKISGGGETRGGLVGNRIPGVGGIGVPVFPGLRSTSGRSSSPAGSVDSSIASGDRAASSSSPHTSRSSSPPTSPGGLPSALLAASLPDDQAGTGARTPSSTMAEAGEEVQSLSSVPSTPIAAPTILPEITSDMVQGDLVPGNLNNHNRLSTPGGTRQPLGSSPLVVTAVSGKGSVAPSVTSSMAVHGVSEGSEDTHMHDVSGISTPMGTPKAAQRELSTRGEGSVVDDASVRGDGSSVKGEGSVAGEDDVELVTKRTGTLGLGDKPDIDVGTDEAGRAPGAEGVPHEVTTESAEPQCSQTPSGDKTAVPDPNSAADLDALKSGALSSPHAHPSETDHPDPATANPVDTMAQAAFTSGLDETVIRPEEKKEQGGVAGQHMTDVELADEVQQPKTKSEIDVDNKDEKAGDVAVEDVTSQIDSDGLPTKKDGKAEPDSAKGDGDNGSAQPQAEELDPDELGDANTKVPDDAVLAEMIKKSTDEEKVEVGPGAEGFKDKTRTKGATQWFEAEYGMKDGDTKGDGKLGSNPEGVERAHDPKDANEHVPGDSAAKVDTSERPESAAESPSEQQKTPTTPKKPLQVQVEPAPIAQPAEDEPSTEDPAAAAVGSDSTDANGDSSPHPHTAEDFPSPPHDALDSLSTKSAAFPSVSGEGGTGASTPIDPSLVKAFPNVPDEDKPRVEVHVSSSPHTTPSKAAPAAAAAAAAATPPAEAEDEADSDSRESQNDGDFVVADAVPLDAAQALEQGQTVQLPAVTGPLTSGQDKKKKKKKKKNGNKPKPVDTAAAQPASSDATGSADLQKKPSTKRSPKSPLLDDEDPGDFDPSQAGWATVTKGRD